MTGLVYGIDFGTSNSAIVVRRPDGTTVRVRDPAAARGGWSVPTSVALARDGSVTVGWAAERAKLARPESYRCEFKRDIGTDTPTRLGHRRYAAHDLAGLVLGFLRAQAAAQVPGDPERVVITVPASWERGQRELMLAAADAAGFDSGITELRPEPVAVAAFAGAGPVGGGPVLVYDLGGGTFDCAVARSTDSGLEVLGAPGGLADVGGAAFDRAIIADLRRRFPDECAELFAGAADPSVLRRRLQLRGSGEEIKVQLSVAASTVAFLTELVPPVEVEYTRADLAELIGPMLAETIAECDRLLDRLGMRWADLERVVPVGGSTRLPLVRELLTQRAGPSVAAVEDPELAVALGAVETIAPKPLPVQDPAQLGAQLGARTEIVQGRVGDFVDSDPNRHPVESPSATLPTLIRRCQGAWFTARREFGLLVEGSKKEVMVRSITDGAVVLALGRGELGNRRTYESGIFRGPSASPVLVVMLRVSSTAQRVQIWDVEAQRKRCEIDVEFDRSWQVNEVDWEIAIHRTGGSGILRRGNTTSILKLLADGGEEWSIRRMRQLSQETWRHSEGGSYLWSSGEAYHGARQLGFADYVSSLDGALFAKADASDDVLITEGASNRQLLRIPGRGTEQSFVFDRTSNVVAVHFRAKAQADEVVELWRVRAEAGR